MATKYGFGTEDNDLLKHNGTLRYKAYGYGGNDTLYGGSNHDKLYGGSGNDRLYGRGGNDYLVGHGGKDYFDGGSGSDTVSYHYYSGNLFGNLTSDTVSFSGGSFSETLISIENLIGGTGNDTLIGDNGRNYLSGGSGNDHLYGRHGNDILYGRDGNDIINGGSGNDNLGGGSGNDTLSGWSGNDYLTGGSGNDFIKGYGHSSNEYDTLHGGTGSDTFVLGDNYGVFYKGLGFATIIDWDASSDFIQVKGSSSQYSLKTENWGGTSASDTVIYSGGDIIGVVQDTTNVSFSRDFKFV